MAMTAGNFVRSFELAAQAQEAQRTGPGEALRRIGEWLGPCAVKFYKSVVFGYSTLAGSVANFAGCSENNQSTDGSAADIDA
jgi:hypothetical protein